MASYDFDETIVTVEKGDYQDQGAMPCPLKIKKAKFNINTSASDSVGLNSKTRQSKITMQLQKVTVDKSHAGNVSARQRCSDPEFKRIFYEDDGRLFCKVCNLVVEHVRRSTIQSHMKSSKHVSSLHKQTESESDKLHAEKGKIQKTVTTAFKQATDAQVERVQVAHEWLHVCTAANIPLNKTDHPAVRAFLLSRVKNGGAIPGTHQLQEAYLPDKFKIDKDKLRNLLADRKLALIFDEMSDDEGRFVLNILAAPLEKNSDGRIVTYLLGTEFLKVTNHTTVSQSIVKVVNEFCIKYENVAVFDTDNAAYMKKAYEKVLSGLFPNAIHITCLAHILNLVGESFRKPFSDLNAFVRSFSQMFFMAGARKGRFLTYLKTNLPEIYQVYSKALMAPDPVQTRWNSWFFSVQYHNKHFTAYKGFIEDEMSACAHPPQSVLSLHETLSDDTKLMKLQVQIAFVTEMCKPILQAMDQFESQRPCTLVAFDRLEELMISFEANALTVEVLDKFHRNFEGLSQEIRNENCQIFKSAFEGAAEKLLKYVSEAPQGQPAIKFLKAVRIFDPARVCVVSHNFQDYNAIPGFADVPVTEFNMYINKLAPEAVSAAGGLWSTERDVDVFWRSMGERLPHLTAVAETYINAVCNSADAERSNSLYNLVLDNRRRSLSENSIKALVFLYYNSNVRA